MGSLLASSILHKVSYELLNEQAMLIGMHATLGRWHGLGVTVGDYIWALQFPSQRRHPARQQIAYEQVHSPEFSVQIAMPDEAAKNDLLNATGNVMVNSDDRTDHVAECMQPRVNVLLLQQLT